MRTVQAAGFTTSAIGLGTWQFGSREWGYGDDYAARGAADIVTAARAAGITLFDTAEIYAFGASERILADALGDGAHGPDAVQIATKCFPVLPLPQVVAARAAASRRRLGGRRIDLYQLHWPNPVVPLSLQADGLRRAVAAGDVAHVGVSNYPLGAWRSIERHLGAPVVSNQVQFSLAHPAPLDDLVPWAADNDRIVIAYSPLAQGFLSARYDAANPPSGAVRRANPLFLPVNLEAGRDLLDTLREVAAGHDRTPAQVALAWLVHQPNTVVIPGASSPAQAEANAAAGSLSLADDEVVALTAAARAFRPRTVVAAAPDLLRARLGV